MCKAIAALVPCAAGIEIGAARSGSTAELFQLARELLERQLMNLLRLSTVTRT
jgi:hypothetical protein